MAVEIRPITFPDRLGTPEAVEFERYAEFAIDIEVERWGDDRLAYTPAEMLAMYRDERYEMRQAFAAWDGDACIGRTISWWERDPAARTGTVIVEVAPAYRRRGLGTRLLEHAEGVITDLGRSIYLGWVDYPLKELDLPGPRLAAPEGDATIPAELPSVRFATHHGYVIGQLERSSALDVDGRVEDFRAESARRESGTSDYRLVGWIDHVPDALVDSYAAARARMVLDVPAGGLTIDEEHWDADRVRTHEVQAIAGGRTLLVQAAVAPDGTIAGYTELELPPGKAVAYQSDTLVVAAHRGHRLGMRMKLANLVRLGEVAPERTTIYTWNADENEHMLAINIALGFEPHGMSAEFQRG
ncbi:GNAT family N-acetyltransferase [Agromyces sp. SYSU K20354]|uniref:GNAT family N-acetyltransferase n=1 Tax=Agromyces cavernae TaxID=2898659 RepID=UPI001E60F535|nr:GNAT family N-acetyltransferase [Agromyces cavernae]MCD2442473.1 GNAT family N-acetyltransferase [Agromyces cavernae]